VLQQSGLVTRKALFFHFSWCGVFALTIANFSGGIKHLLYEALRKVCAACGSDIFFPLTPSLCTNRPLTPTLSPKGEREIRRGILVHNANLGSAARRVCFWCG